MQKLSSIVGRELTGMYTLSAKLTFYISHAVSLKEKRKARRSLIDKTKHKFNVSIAEVDMWDAHKTLTIGIAIVTGGFSHGRDALDKIIRFMEENADGELIDVEE